MERRRWRLGVCGAAVLAVLVGAPGVSGQPAPKGGGAAPASDPAAEVKKRFERGLAAASAKNWKKAAEEFGKAYELKPMPQIAGNLGEAELNLGRYRDAAEHLEKFLREDSGATEAERKAAKEWLEQAKKKIVTFEITVALPGADVLVDGKVVGKSPLPMKEVYVEPGKRTVEARAGDATDAQTDTFEAGWKRVIKLVPMKPAEPVASASATATESPPPSGEASGPSRGLVIGGAAISGALLVAGGVFVGLAVSRASEANGFGGWATDPCYAQDNNNPTNNLDDDDPLVCATRHAANQDAVLFANVSTGMFIGGALVGGATLLYGLGILPPVGNAKKGSIVAVPVVGASGGGLSVTGQF